MSALSFTDHRPDPARWAKDLGISRAAVELYLQSDVIDLHIDSFIWHRVFGYDLRKRHGLGLLGGRFYSQVDFPRALEANLAGAHWVITTNPARNGANRSDTFFSNVRELTDLFASVSEYFEIVRDFAQYRKARAAGKHAVFLAVQGGNALDHGLSLELLDDLILRITLVHLSSSSLGATSSPLGGKRGRGLTEQGRQYVHKLNQKKIFVDLAHISPQGFWDVVETHDRSQPLIVTHTGVSGVFEHWRNLDDRQLRAIADSGGTIGIMYHAPFLGDRAASGRAETIVRHLEHVVRTVGEDHASLGSDWDGAIIPPRDLRSCLELPRIVQLMLDRAWSPVAIQKVLGANFLRVLRLLRG